uniref:Uncharacterized protein n=1 Tax=Caenorhabditis japonica TaxID=281687 RepID=A0A8R1ECB4_CAEJA
MSPAISSSVQGRTICTLASKQTNSRIIRRFEYDRTWLVASVTVVTRITNRPSKSADTCSGRDYPRPCKTSFFT